MKFPESATLLSFTNIESFQLLCAYFLNNNGLQESKIENDNLKRWYDVTSSDMVTEKVEIDGKMVERPIEPVQYYPEQKLHDLLDDYLIPLFNSCLKNFVEETKAGLKGIFNPEDQYYFVEERMEYLEDAQIAIGLLELTEYFNQLKTKAQSSIKETIESFEMDLLPKSIHTKEYKDKIKLKLGKKEVCILFLKLRDADRLPPEYKDDVGLATMLESNFMYFNTQKKSYHLIKNMQNQITRLRTDPTHMTETTVFKDIFCK